MSQIRELHNVDVGCGGRCGIFEKVDKLPLMASPIPMLTIYLAYIAFVLKIGPAFMKNKKSYELRNIMLVYNFVQMILSAYMVMRYSGYLWVTGALPTKCYLNDEKYNDQILNHTWLYTMVKISELLDTVFFVLRKKENQITILHVYHHSVMMLACWLSLKYFPTEHLIFPGNWNALIHFFMYGYYGLAAFGPHMAPYLTWKKYLTSMQMVQFVSMIIHHVLTFKFSECPPSLSVAAFFLVNLLLFTILFGHFYWKNYGKKGKIENFENNSCLQKTD